MHRRQVLAATTEAQMLRGLTTVSFYAADLEDAKRLYPKLLGIESYFERPGYTEFRIRDYQHELGVIDSRYPPDGSATDPAGTVVYWQVDDLSVTLNRLLSMGAKEHAAPADSGGGFTTDSVVDPFRNILGIMHNPYYLKVPGSTSQA
jgi:predicted enzyme related to lactoylglutathione lyase